jgi:MFS family permease
MALLGTRPGHRSGTTAVFRAVTATFAFNGFVFANWAVRIPDVSHQVHATHAALGVALLCISLGALATMRVTGALCERLGSGLVTTLAATLLSVSVATPGLAGSVAALCAALSVFGAASGILNVAMNSAGVGLERSTGRPLLPRLHAAFSLGGLAGGLVAGLAATYLDPAPHLIAVGLAGLLVTGVLTRALRGADEAPTSTLGDDAVAPARGRVGGTVVALGAIAGCTAYGEGVLSDWGTLHLVEDLGASAAVAAGGYAAFSLAMALGRMAGHRLLETLGATRVSVSGALLAAAGMLLAALAPSLGLALLGLTAVGMGLANLFPVAIARAGALAGPRGVGLASTVGYGGLLLGPAAIGFAASRIGLPLSLTTVSLLAAVAAMLAYRVRDEVPSSVRWLPSSAETWVRLRTRMAPVAAGLNAAAARHASSLAALDPRGGGASPSRPPFEPSAFLDLDALFGARATRAESA